MNTYSLTKTLLLFLLTFICSYLIGQDTTAHERDLGQISGSFQIDSQYYSDDSLTGAVPPPENIGVNAWGYLTFIKDNFEVGIRYETYTPALLGYPASTQVSYDGSGIGYRYAKYSNDLLDVTVGNFYEQFGLGMNFRSYEERFLGVDNAMDGIRLRVNPVNGFYIKGIIGKQRLGFNNGFNNGSGIVRGIDGELNFNEAFKGLAESKTYFSLGANFVSKYERDNNSLLKLPENVASYGGRINLQRGKVQFATEYVHKENDPNTANGDIYKNGDALRVCCLLQGK